MRLPRRKPNIDRTALDRMRRSINPGARHADSRMAGPWYGPAIAGHDFTCEVPLQVEYLNSGIAFSSSLVALKMA